MSLCKTCSNTHSDHQRPLTCDNMQLPVLLPAGKFTTIKSVYLKIYLLVQNLQFRFCVFGCCPKELLPRQWPAYVRFVANPIQVEPTFVWTASHARIQVSPGWHPQSEVYVWSSDLVLLSKSLNYFWPDCQCWGWYHPKHSPQAPAC